MLTRWALAVSSSRASSKISNNKGRSVTCEGQQGGNRDKKGNSAKTCLLPAVDWLEPPNCLRNRHQAATKDKDSRLAKHQTCWPPSLVHDDATKDPFDTHKHDKSWSMQHIHTSRADSGGLNPGTEQSWI